MGPFLMLLAGNLQMQLFQINQSEESSKITINAHTTCCPLHQLPITTASTLHIVILPYLVVVGLAVRPVSPLHGGVQVWPHPGAGVVLVMSLL